MTSASLTREIDCPRCHQQCGWCSDPRFMHGELKLPGSQRRCTIPGLEPEGNACPLCAGSKHVIATTTYARIAQGIETEGGDASAAPVPQGLEPGGEAMRPGDGA